MSLCFRNRFMLVIMIVLALYPQGDNGLCAKAAKKLSFTEGNCYIITSKESKKVTKVPERIKIMLVKR